MNDLITALTRLCNAAADLCELQAQSLGGLKSNAKPAENPTSAPNPAPAENPTPAPAPAPAETPAPTPAPAKKPVGRPKKAAAVTPELPLVAPAPAPAVDPAPSMSPEDSLKKALECGERMLQRFPTPGKPGPGGKPAPEGFHMVKEVLSSKFKVGRTGDLTHEQRIEYIQVITDLIRQADEKDHPALGV